MVNCQRDQRLKRRKAVNGGSCRSASNRARDPGDTSTPRDHVEVACNYDFTVEGREQICNTAGLIGLAIREWPAQMKTCNPYSVLADIKLRQREIQIRVATSGTGN